MIPFDPIREKEYRKQRDIHRAAVAAERLERFHRWLARWKAEVSSLPTSARLMVSVNRAHQKRGVSQQRPHQSALMELLHRRKIVHPLWPGHVLPSNVVPLHQHKVVGKAPPRGGNRRLAQAGQGLVEYAFIMVLVVALIFVLVAVFGGQIGAFLQHMYSTLGGI